MYRYFGFYKTDTHFHLECLSPRYAFISIQKENPKKLILMSGTLAKRSISEGLLGLKLQ